MRKCKNGWHLDDARGFKGICSECLLRIPHPTLRRMKRRADELLLRGERRRLVREGLLPDMRQETKRLPLRPRQIADYKQAASLLKEDLVWSGDFDNVRYELLLLIEQHIRDEDFPPAISRIVQKLIAEENDLTI